MRQVGAWVLGVRYMMVVSIGLQEALKALSGSESASVADDHYLLVSIAKLGALFVGATLAGLASRIHPLGTSILVSLVGPGMADLDGERAAYRAFTHDYLNRRLVQAVSRKLEGLPDLSTRLREFVRGIQPSPPVASYEHLWDRVAGTESWDLVAGDIFGEKTELMRGFHWRIRELEEIM